MHELSLLNSLLKKIHQLSAAERKTPLEVRLQLGPLAHISSAHLREHWQQAVADTPLQSAVLHIQELDDCNHPYAQDMVLESLVFASDDDDLHAERDQVHGD